MLWYKVWLETRVRFLICLVGISALCAYRVYDGIHNARAWTLSGVSYYYLVLHSGHQLLQITWLAAVTMLLMGGLLQEKANGAAPFTLALPVSRARLMNVRIWAGLMQSAVLIVVPWAAMYAMSYLSGPALSVGQVVFYAVLLAGGGAVFVGTAMLISSLVEGTYTAPTISAGIVLVCANLPQSLSYVNPMAFTGGRDYLGHANMLIGPMPWGHVGAYFSVATLLIVASVQAVKRRDF